MKTLFIRHEKVAHDTYSFYFEKPNDFNYIAGQFIELTLPHENPDARGMKRWFTLSSAPEEAALAITTKIITKRSSFKNQLFALNNGDEVTISEPMGDFILPKNTNKPLLFVAGGIGVTPYHSMCTSLQLANQQRNITMLYAAATEDHFAFTDMLARQTKLSKTTGLLRPNHVAEAARQLKNPLIYLSGPEPLIEQVNDELSKTYSQSQLIRDYFPNYTKNA